LISLAKDFLSCYCLMKQLYNQKLLAHHNHILQIAQLHQLWIYLVMHNETDTLAKYYDNMLYYMHNVPRIPLVLSARVKN